MRTAPTGNRHDGALKLLEQYAILLFGALLVAFTFVACSRQPSSKNIDANGMTEVGRQECLETAKKALGQGAQVGKCGHLIGKATSELVAFLKPRKLVEDENGIPVSRLVILQKSASQWRIVLDVAREIQNQAGYVGIDYIDNSQRYFLYRVKFPDQRSDGHPAFVVQLTYLNSEGKPEGIPIEISWNARVGRFQEFSVNQEQKDSNQNSRILLGFTSRHHGHSYLHCRMMLSMLSHSCSRPLEVQHGPAVLYIHASNCGETMLPVEIG